MFRDTFAVELLLAGVPIDQVSVLLGHHSIKMTENIICPGSKPGRINLLPASGGPGSRRSAKRRWREGARNWRRPGQKPVLVRRWRAVIQWRYAIAPIRAERGLLVSISKCETEIIAGETAGRYTICSEITWQTRCLVVGTLDIRVAADGLFAAGRYPYD